MAPTIRTPTKTTPQFVETAMSVLYVPVYVVYSECLICAQLGGESTYG